LADQAVERGADGARSFVPGEVAGALEDLEPGAGDDRRLAAAAWSTGIGLRAPATTPKATDTVPRRAVSPGSPLPSAAESPAKAATEVRRAGISGADARLAQ